MQANPPDLPARYPASKLEPHRAAIEKLRSADYSLQQIRAYLEQCGVTVSVQMVSKFLRGRDASPRKAKTRGEARASSPTPASDQQPEPPSPAGASVAHKTRDEIAAENPALRAKDIEERYVDQFATATQNPLLRRRKAP
ncbi:hypothetical protein PPGU16_84530 (plasmid) [Paraburkholderia largidicola]|uniref:Uncharacterized protein n=2 Tax=Paraburkholderia largidicola TaxID=3014751 RepID=A0A7I8C2S4_9BURK|nr:hypothetical protein PPGU16_84530 [Paraburkholderia sp. PGU16]